MLAFTPSSLSTIKLGQSISYRTTKIHSTSQIDGPAIGFENSCVLTMEQVAPIIILKKGTPKEKVVNAFGIYSIIITIILNPIWTLAMTITDGVCNAFPELDPDRAFFDMTGKVWARSWLSLCGSYPTISGDVERLKEDNDLGACLFVANHASWLDIPVLCTVLDPGKCSGLAFFLLVCNVGPILYSPLRKFSSSSQKEN